MAATIADLGARVLRRLGIAAVAASARPPQAGPVTADTIAREALQFLGVIAADETPATSDLAVAQEKVAHLHDSLIAQGIVSWPASAIPAGVAEDMMRLVAMHLAPVFGKTADPALLEGIEGRIRRVSLLLTAPALAEQAVMDVHAQLDARGKARWSVFDISDAVAPSYVLMASYLVAPQFGIQADPAWWAQGEKAIMQLIALGSSGENVRAEYF